MLVIDKIPEMVQPNVYNVIDQMENNIIIIYFFSTVILPLQMICSTEGIIQHESGYKHNFFLLTEFFC